ncbi:hypothetical protein ACFLSY_03135 [Bacteroidota bacterium]
MKLSVKILILSVIISLALYCTKIENYPDIPRITFNDVIVKDSIDVLGNNTKVVDLSFIVYDGNGDIGLNESDSFPPFNKTSIYYYNLFIKEFEKIGDDFFELTDTEFPRNYRIPMITPKGQNKNLKATINVAIEYSYNDQNPLPFSIFKYEFYLVDRALNQSNTDTSTTISF